MPTPVISNVFGRNVSAAQIERAALAVIQEWMPEYLAEQEKQEGWVPGTLAIPTNYMNRNSFDDQAGEVLPKVIAISPGTSGPPHMQNGTQYRVMWQLGIGVAHAAKDEDTVNDQIKAYGAVVRKILLDKQSLGNFVGVSQIIWVSETYEDLGITNQVMQTRGAGVYFLVDVENVVTARHGPKTHNQPSFGQVQEIDIDLIKDPITE